MIVPANYSTQDWTKPRYVQPCLLFEPTAAEKKPPIWRGLNKFKARACALRGQPLRQPHDTVARSSRNREESEKALLSPLALCQESNAASSWFRHKAIRRSVACRLPYVASKQISALDLFANQGYQDNTSSMPSSWPCDRSSVWKFEPASANAEARLQG